MRGEVVGLYLSAASTLCASTMGIFAKLAGGVDCPLDGQLGSHNSVQPIQTKLPQLELACTSTSCDLHRLLNMAQVPTAFQCLK
jgi:hypothetical protein